MIAFYSQPVEDSLHCNSKDLTRSTATPEISYFLQKGSRIERHCITIESIFSLFMKEFDENSKNIFRNTQLRKRRKTDLTSLHRNSGANHIVVTVRINFELSTIANRNIPTKKNSMFQFELNFSAILSFQC